MTPPPILLVSADVWRTTSEVFSKYASKRVEAGCFWYGHRNEEKAFVILVGVPHQINRPRNFEVPADDLARLTEEAVKLDLVAVAQLHSHPGDDVEHSPWDDSRAISKRVYSLVLPRYGKNPIPLAGVGVHRFEDGRWTKLSRDSWKAVIRFLPDKLDTR